MSFPSGILATEVFRSVGFFVHIRGSHLGGFLLGQLPWLGPAPSPRLVCGWQCPVSVCSLHSLCIVQWLSSGVSLTLLALFRVCLLPMGWVFYPFLFSQASFVSFFPCPESLALLCLCGGACRGVLCPRGLPSMAGFAVSRS